MILGDCGAGRCRVPRSPRPVDRVDWTVGALKECLCWTWRLQAEATTPWLKQYLGEVIERSERLAGEVESASEKD
jgi:hypothetical protein